MITIYFYSLPISLLIGAIIGASRGRIVAGMLWAFLGPIGWLIMFLSEDKREKCPKCGSVVNDNAFICKSCGNRLVVTFDEYKKRSLDPMANWKDVTHQENEESDDTPSPPPPKQMVRNGQCDQSDKIYLLVNDKKIGPFSRGQVQDQLNAGMIIGDTMFWHKGMTEWRSISEFQ